MLRSCRKLPKYVRDELDIQFDSMYLVASLFDRGRSFTLPFIDYNEDGNQLEVDGTIAIKRGVG